MNVNELNTTHLRKLVLLFAMALSWASLSYGQIDCYALDFDGNDDHVRVSNSIPLCPTDGENFTVSAWFNMDVIKARAPIVSIVNSGDGTDAGTFVIRAEGTNLRVFAYNPNGTLVGNINNAAGLSPLTWYHVAVTYDGTDFELFLDGVSLGTTAVSLPNPGDCAANTFLIGRRRVESPPSDAFFQGLIDDVAIWSDDLTASQVSDLATETSTVAATSPGDLEAYYNMEDGTGNTATDQSSNSFDGTLVDMDEEDWVITDLVPFVCPPDVTITCGDSMDPADTGEPSVPNCPFITLDYNDVVTTPGSCGVSEVITRTWTADNGEDNPVTCDQLITVDPIVINVNTVVFPPDITVECTGAATNTSPDVTGEPELLNGDPIDDLPAGCGIIVMQTDTEIDVNSCTGKPVIKRTWIIMDITCDVTLTDNQYIHIEDTTDPVVDCPDDQVLVADGNCEASVDLDSYGASATDGCCIEPTLSYSSTSGSIDPVTNVISGLTIGDHVITVTAEDACGNTDECTFTITVADLTNPVAVCDAITISISGDPTNVPAENFDKESFDNCGIVSIQARRMDNPDCPGDDETDFADYVPFSCCDVGFTIIVALRVEDAAGNFNICMVGVPVDDKLDPDITCPPDVTVDCWEDTSPANTGTATATDNCGADVDYEDVEDINNCNTGTITRTWTATDPSGNTDECVQIITISNLNPFTEDDITWPDDFGDTGCTLPTATGEPEYDDGPCDLISHSILHETEYDIANGCIMIQREWIVVDLCQDGAGPGGYAAWTHTQTIVVLNSEDPEILNCGVSDDFCSYDPDCEEGTANLTVEVQDDCNDVNFMYRVDVNDDGPGPGDQDWTPDDNGDVTNTYPLGTHRVYWKIFDGCNNTVLCDYEFTIKDCQAPQLTTHDIISAELDPGVPGIEQWATDWVVAASTSDNCGIEEYLVQVPSLGVGQSAPPVSAAGAYTFTCADLLAYGSIVEVDVWVRDAEFNWTYTTPTIELEDLMSPYCSNVDHAIVSGGILNEEGDEVEYVHVEASGDVMNEEQMTGNEGIFSFDLPANQNYTVTPERDDNILNGVSTLDLVKINKHILQTEILASPYKLIAADVNHSGAVSAIDMVELRKVILFIETEFPNNASWRFVDATFVFPNPANPFATPFPEVYTVNGLTEDEVADFVGVKIGDVNCSAAPNDLVGNGDDRNNETLQFVVNDQELTIGETYTVDFNAADFKAVEGFQFTLNFATDALELEAINSANLKNLSDANFGTHLLSEGVITASWNTYGTTETLQDGEAVFSMTFTAKANGQLRDLLSVNSRYTVAEAYAQNEVSDLGVIFSTENGVFTSNQLELFQNRPNPFKDETVIGFNLPEAGKATMTIFDISGRTIEVIDGDFAKGYNEISLNRSDLQATGVLYYQLESANSIASMKMVLMD